MGDNAIKWRDILSNYADLLVTSILFCIGLFYSPQTGLVVASVGLVIYASRILILEKLKNSFDVYRLKDKIYGSGDIDFINEAKEAERIYMDKLKSLSSETLHYSNIVDYFSDCEEHVEKSKKEVCAFAFINPNHWNEDKQLGKYLANQIEAKKRNPNLDITRIFFLSEDELKNNKVKKVLQTHLDGGVKVFITERKFGKSTMPFVIIDDEMVFKVTSLDDDLKIKEGCKITNVDQITDLKKQFMDVKNSYSEQIINASPNIIYKKDQ